MNLQMKGGIGRDMWEGAQSFHALSPSPSPCSLTKNLPEPHSLEIFMEASSYRHDPSLTPSLAPLPSLEGGSEAESSKFLIMTWSFW